MQRANIKGPPPAPPSLARPRNTHSSPPFFTTLPTLLLPLLPFLFFPTLLFLLRIFHLCPRRRLRAADTREGTRERGKEREREKQGQDRLPGMQKQEGMSSNRVHFLPTPRFSSRFTEPKKKPGPRPPHEGYNNVQLPLLSRRLRDWRLGEGSRGGFGINAC